MAKKDLIKRADGSYSPRGLWDNIRAAKGSGKEPTKEMLAQEKKIKREMAKGGSLSHFYPSNIQAYPDGGDLGKGAFYASPYYTNTLTGSQVPSAMLGYTTVPAKGRGKEGWQFSGQVGMPYQKYDPANLPDTQPAIGQSLNTFITDEFYGKMPISAGLEASYTGIPNYGRQGRGYINLKTDYNPNSGLGISAIGGPQFVFGKEAYSRGELRPGYAFGKVTPYGGIAASTAPTNNTTGLTYGVLAEGEWKPKFMRNTPFSLYGKGSFGASPAAGKAESVVTDISQSDPNNVYYHVEKEDDRLTARPTFRGEIGVRMPVQQLKDVNLPKLPEINMSPLTSFLGKANDSSGEDLQMQGGDPMGDFGPRYNASPIDKRWNKGAADIYVPSTKEGFNPESIIYDPNNPEGTNNFAEGGTMPDPDLPLAIKKAVDRGSFVVNPFYSHSMTGAAVPQYSIGFGTAPDPRKGGWSVLGRVGQEYPGLNAQLDPISEQYQTPMYELNESNYNAGTDPYILQYVEDYNKGVKTHNKLRPLLPGALENVSYGLEANYRGKKGLDGQPYYPEAGIRADYSQSGGLGISGGGSAQFNFGRHNYRNGQLKDGYAAGSAGPFIDFSLNPLTGIGFNYGARAHVDWRPKFFNDVPGMLYGKGYISANAGGNFPIGAGGEVGYKLPMAKAKQIDLPKIPMPNMSPLAGMFNKNLQDAEYAPNASGETGTGWGSRGLANASPIEKQENSEMGDIYIPTNSSPEGESVIYDPTNSEGFNQENNYKQGGAMNFKSPAAYKAWLAYGHASGEFAKTPGNQAVSIKGQPHKVQHAFGGNMYSMGGRAFADGGQLTQFTEGGSHEMNPLGGIPQGFAPDGKLNLVEQGETKLNAADYIFSDQIKVSKEIASLYGLSKGDVGKTFADVSKKANRPNSRRENDTIEQVAIQRDLENLMQAQEQQKEMEKQEAIAEMEAKYPGVQVVDQAAMQQADAMMQEGMQQPMMDEAAMMQQQQQMAPPAQAPQEIDPAMMAQMQQQGMMRMGGKMFNMGGHMYGNGGTFWRGVGAGAYGVAEGMLDTLTFGLTDNLTDKGYQALSGLGKPLDSKQAARLDATRGFGNAAGAVGAAALTGGATTKSAISEGVEGLAQGVSSLPGTNEKVDKVAQGVGQAASIFGSVAGGAPKNMNAIPLGVTEGNKAVTQLMNLPQNPFITQAVNTTGRMFASGGFLGAPTNNMFVNQLDPGGPLGESTVTFNINGKPVTMSYEQAINDPTILDMFMPAEADVDGDGQYSPEDIYLAKEALRDHFDVMGTLQPAGMAVQDNVAADVTPAAGMTAEEYIATLEKPAGMSQEEWNSALKKMKTDLTQKKTLEEIKASPLLATASALPALYNIGRGLFGKVDQLNVKDYLNNATISPYEMNIDPQLAAAQRAYSTAMQATRNAAPGAGSYLATLGNLATQKQQAIKDLYAQKENFDKAQKLEADKYNAQVEKENLQTDLTIQQYNNQARAAKQNLLAAGLTQLADAAQGLSTTDLQEKYLQTIAPEFAGSFQYLSIPEQLAALAAARAGRKGKGTKAENV